MNATEQSVEMFTAYRLSSMTEGASPDSPESPGAAFLLCVQDAAAECAADLLAAPGVDVSDIAHEIADSAVPVYTHERWLVFVDLAAYEVDVADLVGGGEDMTTLAGFALYEIARSLVWSLSEEWRKAL